MAILAIDTEKLNNLSYQVKMLHDQCCLGFEIDPVRIEHLKSELNRFKGIRELDSTLAALHGSLYFASGDLLNMQFQYKMAIRLQPNNSLIRYNFVSALLISQRYDLAREQLVELSPYVECTKEYKLIGDTYRLMEQQLLLPQCEKLLMTISAYPDKPLELQQWIQQRKELFAAYKKFRINVEVVQQLLDEINRKLRKKMPKTIDIKHYYEPIANEIYYVFVDKVSDVDTLFAIDQEIAELTIDFEEKHNVNLRNFLIYYGAW